MDRAASLDSVEACQGTAVPLDNLHEDTQMVPVVFHKHHTWAPLGNWPWGSAGLGAKHVNCYKRKLGDVVYRQYTGFEEQVLPS